MTRLIQFILFLLVPIVNYAVAVMDGQQRFDDDPLILNNPAGYAFAIWGPIFIGMIYYSFVVWKKMDNAAIVQKSTYAGISAALASIAFVPISMMDMQWLTLVNILWHLISLIVLYRCNHEMRDKYKEVSRWTYLGPQLYLGWISAATTISVALALREAGVSFGTTTEAWLTVLLIATLTLVASYLSKHRGMTIVLVVIWALIGITVEHPDISIIRNAVLVAVAFSVVGLIIDSRKLEWI